VLICSGVTDGAAADHRRDLPLTNGIREDLKGLLALTQGTRDYKEAVLALAARLRTLQVCPLSQLQRWIVLECNGSQHPKTANYMEPEELKSTHNTKIDDKHSC
jgi:hypothetical protein